MEQSTFDSAVKTITPILFGLAGILATLMFVMTRFKLDLSMILLTSLFLVCFFVRLPFVENVSQREGDNPIFVSAFLLIFAMLYFFVFEMRRLRDKIDSDSMKENLAKRKRTNFIKYVIFGLFLIGNALIILGFVMFQRYSKDPEKLYFEVFDVLIPIRFFIVMGIDTFMAIQFFIQLKFYVENKGTWEVFTLYNKIILISTLFLLFCFLSRAYIGTTLFTLLNTTYIKFDDRTRILLNFIIHPVTWILDFFIFCGLMYLFFYQALKIQKMQPP